MSRGLCPPPDPTILHCSSPDLTDIQQVCKRENCGTAFQTPIRTLIIQFNILRLNALTDTTITALLYRVLLWNCASECDYTCQHIITARRLSANQPIVQFYGKWPFHRFLGMQEPFSVLFSLGNLWAHWEGLQKIRTNVSPSYTMRRFYIRLAYVNLASWIASSVFHMRDFKYTEEADYFAAGANVLYGLYYTPIRIFRLHLATRRRRSLLRLWTIACVTLYILHVAYLKFVKWDYTYNMAANCVIGLIQHMMWTWFSINQYRKSKRVWSLLPSLVVAWIMFAMSMELFDFPPWMGSIDAHSLWHLMTIAPTVLWYK